MQINIADYKDGEAVELTQAQYEIMRQALEYAHNTDFTMGDEKYNRLLELLETLPSL